MSTLQENMIEYKSQLRRGAIQAAYRGLMEYMLSLRTHFSNNYPQGDVSGSLYYGAMDMTFFTIQPPAFKQRSLKVVVVFTHENFRFEVWLAGANKQVQKKYWQFFKNSGAQPYSLVPSPQGTDAILTHVLVAEPNFDDLPELTHHLELGTRVFIQELQQLIGNQD
jgi:hypothetical protein